MIWKGHLSFGLVNIPVALHPAVTRDELDFTLLDKKDMSSIGYREVNKRTGEEVPANRSLRDRQRRGSSTGEPGAHAADRHPVVYRTGH